MPEYCNKAVLWASINLVLVFLYVYLLRGDVQLIKGHSDAATITSHSTNKHGLIRSGENCNDKDTTTTKPHITLAVAIGSKVEYLDRRNLIRNSWMQWATNSSSVIIKFFSDQPSTENLTAIETELHTYQDMVLSPSTLGGYWSSMARTLHQMEWFLERYDFDYFLRVDDDGFLCIPSVLHDLQNNNAPANRFVWAKYFCVPNKILPDENFFLMSRDLVEFFHTSCGGAAGTSGGMSNSILRINDQATFASHFGVWQHLLHLNVLDDQARINAQQGYVATYMQSGDDIQNFCQDHVWSHYVRNPRVFQKVFELADAHYQNHNPPHSNFQSRIGQICYNVSSPKDALRGPGQSCSAVTTSLYKQTGSMPGFQGSKGFPNIVSNADYSCASPPQEHPTTRTDT